MPRTKSQPHRRVRPSLVATTAHSLVADSGLSWSQEALDLLVHAADSKWNALKTEAYLVASLSGRQHPTAKDWVVSHRMLTALIRPEAHGPVTEDDVVRVDDPSVFQ